MKSAAPFASRLRTSLVFLSAFLLCKRGFGMRLVAIAISALLFCAITLGAAQVQRPSGLSNLTGLTEETSPASEDLLYIVTDPEGTPTPQKIAVENVTAVHVAQGDPHTGYVLGDTSAGTPSAGSCDRNSHIITDTTNEIPYFCSDGTGGNPRSFAELGDAHNGIVVGATTVAASGSEDLRHLDVLGLTTAKATYNGTATFTNQPSNDGLEAVSSNAGDTTQTLTAYCTLEGGDASLAHIVTIALDGTNVVASTETTLDDCWVFTLSATTAGTVTIREASGNATIATITAGNTSAADLDTILTRRDFLSITLNVDRDAALADTDDRGDFWINTLGRTITIHQIKGWTDTGTSTINIMRDDGSAADICTSDLVASTSGVTCTLSATEKLISDGHKLDFDMVTAATSGTPTKVTVNIKAY